MALQRGDMRKVVLALIIVIGLTCTWLAFRKPQTRDQNPEVLLPGSKVRRDNASMLRRFQPLLQLLLPNGCPGMNAVTTGLFGDWNQHEMTVLYSFDFSFRNSEFRWIDEIVG
jgi:hypothetical protein